MRASNHGGVKHHVDLPTHHILNGGAAALVGHVDELGARLEAQQFQRQVLACTVASRSRRDGFGFGFCRSDHILQRLEGTVLPNDEHHRI